jgi:hypothetical protein
VSLWVTVDDFRKCNEAQKRNYKVSLKYLGFKKEEVFVEELLLLHSDLPITLYLSYTLIKLSSNI